jgi:membrane-bound metal-dependent hydrolase YbcI (DUF457 family)
MRQAPLMQGNSPPPARPTFDETIDVTVFEHFMLGGNLALAAGLHHRFGWRIVAIAAVASAVPDWDGLTILFGSSAYARGHRVWGHNLLAAGLAGTLVAMLEYCCNVCGGIQKLVATRWQQVGLPPEPSSKYSATWLGVCVLTGLIASFSHLFADFFYSGRGSNNVWPLQLLWPFSERSWAYPILPWGDLGATLIFVVEMFALYRWPTRMQLIAILTLLSVVAYVALRWAIP